MLVTVAICTWNRSDLLDKTLAELRHLRVPEGVRWELLVVDNNSTDATAAVLARHEAEGRLPLRRLFEPKQGLSNARNCAVDHARGELMLWTDDDVLADPDWLAAYVAASKAWPAAAFFGGPVRAWPEFPPPEWMTRLFDTPQRVLWALVDYGPADRALLAAEYPVGANLAIRTDLQRAYRYNSDLGNNGKVLAGGEEVDVLGRARQGGATGAWVSGAKVRHFIPAGRLTSRYVSQKRRWLAAGECDPGDFAGCARVGGLPRYVVRQYVVSRLKAWLLAPTRSAAWANALVTAAGCRGVLDACRRHTN